MLANPAHLVGEFIFNHFSPDLTAFAILVRATFQSRELTATLPDELV
jgi:hypothetical protein